MPTYATQINDPWTSVDMVLPVIIDNDKIRLILAKFHLVEGRDLHNEQFHKLGIYHKSLWCFIFLFFSIFYFLVEKVPNRISF